MTKQRQQREQREPSEVQERLQQAADDTGDLPQEGRPAWEPLPTDDAPDRHAHWGMHPEQHEGGRQFHYPDGQGGVVKPTNQADAPTTPSPLADREPDAEAGDRVPAVRNGPAASLVDQRTQRSLDAVQDLAGLVEVEAFAARYLADTDQLVGLTELCGEARQQLTDRHLIPRDLKVKIADFARAWADQTT